MKATYRKSWVGNLLKWSDLTLSTTFKVKRGQPNVKVLISRLLLILDVCNVKPTYRISWAGNLLMDVRFDLWPLLQGQMMSCLSSGYKFALVLRWFSFSLF